MTDWNNPTTTSSYSSVLTDLNGKLTSVAKMDFSSDTNVPTGAFRINETTKALEKWSGSAWAESVYAQRAMQAHVTTGGTSTAYTLTPVPAFPTYVAGDIVVLVPHVTCGASPTLDVSGLGTKNINYLGQSLVGGEMVANVRHFLYYDGTNWILLNHGGGFATWTPTVSGSGSLTFSTSLVINRADYQRHGNEVKIWVDISATSGGTANTEFRFTVPVTAAAALGNLSAQVSHSINGPGGAAFNSTSQVAVYRHDGSNYSAASVATFVRVSGSYKV